MLDKRFAEEGVAGGGKDTEAPGKVSIDYQVLRKLDLLSAGGLTCHWRSRAPAALCAMKRRSARESHPGSKFDTHPEILQLPAYENYPRFARRLGA